MCADFDTEKTLLLAKLLHHEMSVPKIKQIKTDSVKKGTALGEKGEFFDKILQQLPLLQG